VPLEIKGEKEEKPSEKNSSNDIRSTKEERIRTD